MKKMKKNLRRNTKRNIYNIHYEYATFITPSFDKDLPNNEFFFFFYEP